MTTLLELTPFDTLFFRDGRAFDAADGVDAHSIFPPMPQTVQGMVRSRLLADHCGRWIAYANACQTPGGPCEASASCAVRDVVGRIGETGSIRLSGPWLQVDGQCVLPAPADLVALDDDRKRLEQFGCLATALLAPQARERRCNHPGALVPLSPPKAFLNAEFGTVDGWLSWEAFTSYLGGRAPTLVPGQNWWRPADLWATERRPGLAMEKGRGTASEGLLYFASHTRLASGFHGSAVRLAVEVSGDDGLATGVKLPCPLGGERRAVGIEAVPSGGVPWAACPDLMRAAANASGLKLVLLQPAWLKHGYYGDGWQKGERKQGEPARARLTFNIVGQPGGSHDLTWVSAVVGRPERVGGWNMAVPGRHGERAARLFVPRGSVFYFEPQAGLGIQEVIRDLWRVCISDTPPGQAPEFSSIGLGESLPGVWSRSEE